MAVKYEFLKEKLETAPLNERELEVIGYIEALIDEAITEFFDGGEVHFAKGVIDFTYDPHKKENYAFDDIKFSRKLLMTEELKSRYVDAVWEWEYHMDDGLDGPNMSGPDYWILKGKDND